MSRILSTNLAILILIDSHWTEPKKTHKVDYLPTTFESLYSDAYWYKSDVNQIENIFWI